MCRLQTYSQFLPSLLSCSRTLSPTMTPQLKTPIPSSVWLTKGRPGSTVSALCWTNRKCTRTKTHTWMLLACFCRVALYSRNWLQRSVLPVIVCVWFVCVCAHSLQSSTRLGRKSLEPWENNTWGQGRASCSSSQSLTEEGEWQFSSCANSHACFSSRLSFCLHASVYCSQLHTLFLPSSASRSAKTINLAAILSLVAARRLLPDPRCCSCHFLLFSTLPLSSCSLEFTSLCTFVSI